MACSSDKQTIHIFAVQSGKYDIENGIKLSDEEAKIQAPADQDFENDERPENKKSKLNFMKGILPKYFADEWSFAKFKVPKDDNS